MMNICHSLQALQFCMRSLWLRDKTEEGITATLSTPSRSREPAFEQKFWRLCTW